MADDAGLGNGGTRHVSMADADLDTSDDGGLDGSSGILRSVEQPSSALSTSSFGDKLDLDASKHPPSSPTAVRMTKPVLKKKGTAATKKGPPKRPKSVKMKGPRIDALTGEGQDGGRSSDDDMDSGPYCICRGPDDHRWMISCDVCEDWFHGECINIDKERGEKLIERFVCPNCTDGKQHYSKYKKTCSLAGCINPARIYGKKDNSVFCSTEHCDAWWASIIATLPTKAATKNALEVLTQEDFMGLLASTANQGGWKLGDKPFGTHARLLSILLT
jgi:COMPASS component SPP1